MSLQNDPRYFPQPDVPTNNKYNVNFGKEQLYQAYLPRSANVDLENAAAGDKIPSKGKYIFNPATGQYTWMPAAVTTNINTTPAAAVVEHLDPGRGGGSAGTADVGLNGISSSNSSGSGQGFSGSTTDGSPSTGAASIANSAAATLGNLGLTSLSNALASQVSPNYGNEGRNAPPTVVSNPDYGNEGRNSVAPAPTPAQQNAEDSKNYGYGGEQAPAPVNNDTSGYAPTFTSQYNGGFQTAPAVSNDGSDGSAGMGPGGESGPGGDGGGRGDGGGDGGGGGMGHGGESGPGGDGGGRGGSWARGGLTAFATGGLGSLGGYSDGGRLLRGPGDGVSDSIPAVIGKKRPARLADGEFVVPARIVSELGNGSTEAGARKLYAMLDRIQAGRKKSIGKGKVATNSRMDKNLPA